jgi:hypothetical protein
MQRDEAQEQQRGSKGWTFWSGTMAEADEYDRQEWLSATPRERMEALEFIRSLNYGYAREDQPRPELQRVYRVAELRRG